VGRAARPYARPHNPRIAHRLSTARQADEIYVVAEGRVVEQGTHAALLGAGGAYTRLHMAAGEDDIIRADSFPLKRG